MPGNTTNANWKVYYAATVNATAASPTILQTVASDHFNHGADISTAGFVVGGPNRNLADFFQIAVDPMGFAFIGFADDSGDFSGHTWVTHQVSGLSLQTGTFAKVRVKEPAVATDLSQPEVMDWRHDARLAGDPPTQPDVDSPVDIVSIDFACATGAAGMQVVATMRTSGLNTLPPGGTWRMNFATNPTKPGLSDRADQWFLAAETDPTGVPTYSYGTAVRNRDGTLTLHEARSRRCGPLRSRRPIGDAAGRRRQAQRAAVARRHRTGHRGPRHTRVSFRLRHRPRRGLRGRALGLDTRGTRLHHRPGVRELLNL